MAKPKYPRVIVKLSGEALSGPEKFGIHQPTLDRFAKDLIAARKLGIALGVVVGGGNVLRGAQISENGLSRPILETKPNFLRPNAQPFARCPRPGRTGQIQRL